jgi:hypothetical protein
MYIIAIYALMIYKAPYVIFLMRADPLRGQVGGDWALEIETFFGTVKWHRALGGCHLGPKKAIHLVQQSPYFLLFIRTRREKMKKTTMKMMIKETTRRDDARKRREQCSQEARYLSCSIFPVSFNKGTISRELLKVFQIVCTVR